MDIKSIIRTSAIIYADESNSVSTNTIRRKFIEAVYIENENKSLNINDLISAVEEKFSLLFSIEETILIINKSEDKIFNIRQVDESMGL